MSKNMFIQEDVTYYLYCNPHAIYIGRAVATLWQFFHTDKSTF